MSEVNNKLALYLKEEVRKQTRVVDRLEADIIEHLKEGTELSELSEELKEFIPEVDKLDELNRINNHRIKLEREEK